MVGLPYDEWAASIDEQVEEMSTGRMLLIRKALVLAALGAAVRVEGRLVNIPGVVFLTPVDTGRARASWTVSYGPQPRPDDPGPGTFSLDSVAAAQQEATEVLTVAGPEDTIWISSNLPYIEVLEFGMYPDPPARGTHVRGEGYEVRSAGGYSQQAPNGMVRVTFDQLQRVLDRLS